MYAVRFEPLDRRRDGIFRAFHGEGGREEAIQVFALLNGDGNVRSLPSVRYVICPSDYEGMETIIIGYVGLDNTAIMEGWVVQAMKAVRRKALVR
jgi:hypothetical protein